MAESLIKSKDMTEFEADLKELAAAYNDACAGIKDINNENERGVIFDAICMLGAEMIDSMKDDPAVESKIQAVIDRLDIRGPKNSLYQEMLLHGTGRAFQSFMIGGDPTPDNAVFSPDNFKRELETILSGIEAIRLSIRSLPGVSGVEYSVMSAKIRSEFPKAKEVASLPLHFQGKALEIARGVFAEFDAAYGGSLSNKPRVFKIPGVKNYMEFERHYREEAERRRFPERYRRMEQEEQD